jgi:hypothetical protein
MLMSSTWANLGHLGTYEDEVKYYAHLVDKTLKL